MIDASQCDLGVFTEAIQPPVGEGSLFLWCESGNGYPNLLAKGEVMAEHHP